jgi:hypothetical protein
LVEENVLTDADTSTWVFTAGSGWIDMPKPQAKSLLEGIRGLMSNAGYDQEVKIVDLWGNTVAKISPGAIKMGPFEKAQPNNPPASAGPPGPESPGNAEKDRNPG